MLGIGPGSSFIASEMTAALADLSLQLRGRPDSNLTAFEPT